MGRSGPRFLGIFPASFGALIHLGQHLHKMAARDPNLPLVAMATKSQPPTNAEGRGLESEAWEVALDHSDSLCPAFLPHLRRSGPPAAQGGRCRAGEWSRC